MYLEKMIAHREESVEQSVAIAFGQGIISDTHRKAYIEEFHELQVWVFADCMNFATDLSGLLLGNGEFISDVNDNDAFEQGLSGDFIKDDKDWLKLFHDNDDRIQIQP